MYQQFSWGSKVLFWIITVTLWAALFTPLIISAETLFPFQTGKGIAYRILIEIAGFFFLWLAMIEPAARPKRSLLLWAVLVWVGSLILTTLTAVNPYRSFWGDIERMEGLFGILHGVLLFIIIYSLFRRKEDWLRFFKVSLLGSFMVTMYAFAQVYPIFRFLHVFEARDVQPGSTLGNPAFVSTYSIFQIFFAVFILIWEKNRWWQIYGAALFILNFIILGLSAIRGAQVGMLAAIFAGSMLSMVYLTRQFKTKFAIAAATVLVAVGFWGVRTLKDTPIFSKLPLALQQMSRISFQTNSAKTRFLSLGMSWQAFKERPIFGYGLENFKVGYNKNFNPEHLTYEQAWFDRAHNKLAEVMVQNGAVGLLSYLSIFAIAFWGLLKFIRTRTNSTERLIGIGAAMLGVAYFVQNVFLFDMPMSYLVFFSALGFVGFLNNSSETTKETSPHTMGSHPRSSGMGAGQNQKPQPIKKFRSDDLSTGKLIALVASAGATLFLIFWANWRPYQTAKYGRASMDAQTPQQALELWKKAEKYGGYPYSEVIRVMEDSLINGGRARAQEWSEAFTYTKEQVEKFLVKEPTDPRFFIRTGKLYNERAFLEPQYLNEAERVLRKAMELSPTRPDAYYELGVTYLIRKENDKALELFRHAVELNPRNSRAHWVLGLALLSLERRQEGLAEIEKAIELGYNWDTDADINNLTQIYASLQKFDSLINLYEQVISRHPDNAQYRVTLAIAYANIGQKQKAKEQALKAVDLDQQYAAGAQEFIRKLEAQN